MHHLRTCCPSRDARRGAALLALATLPALAQATPAPQAQPQQAQPQQAEPAAQTLEQLAARVTAAHRVAADLAEVEGFRADLRIRELAREAEHRVEVELQVWFREWQKPDPAAPDGGRPWPLIRYKQIDSARTVEYGRDQKDYWALLDGRVQDLRRRELESDLQSCRRNLKLARQMVRFLAPGEVLSGLAEASAVTRTRLQLGRAIDAECTTVRGRLDGFPLRQTEGDDVPVLAEVFVDDQARLLALEVTPLREDGAPQQGAGEFLLFADYREHQGRLVPMRVTHFAVTAPGVRRAQMQVDITTLSLGGDIPVEEFDRPQS